MYSLKPQIITKNNILIDYKSWDALKEYNSTYRVLAIDGLYSKATAPEKTGLIMLLQEPNDPSVVYWCWTPQTLLSGSVSIKIHLIYTVYFVFYLIDN